MNGYLRDDLTVSGEGLGSLVLNMTKVWRYRIELRPTMSTKW